jgi:hypothetical protein
MRDERNPARNGRAVLVPSPMAVPRAWTAQGGLAGADLRDLKRGSNVVPGRQPERNPVGMAPAAAGRRETVSPGYNPGTRSDRARPLEPTRVLGAYSGPWSLLVDTPESPCRRLWRRQCELREAPGRGCGDQADITARHAPNPTNLCPGRASRGAWRYGKKKRLKPRTAGPGIQPSTNRRSAANLVPGNCRVRLARKSRMIESI